jgi:hypothetical protein
MSSTPNAIITLDKKQLTLAGITTDNLKHPALYTTSKTSVTYTENNGPITQDFDITLGSYITITIKSGAYFYIIRQHETETYTFDLKSNSLDIKFTVPPNDITEYSKPGQFTIPGTNKLLKFEYNTSGSTMTSPTGENKFYHLVVTSGVVDVVYLKPEIDISNDTKTILEPVDDLNITVKRFIIDLGFDLLIMFISWTTIIKLSYDLLKQDAEDLYPIDPTSNPYCKDSKSVKNIVLKYNNDNFSVEYNNKTCKQQPNNKHIFSFFDFIYDSLRNNFNSKINFSYGLLKFYFFYFITNNITSALTCLHYFHKMFSYIHEFIFKTTSIPVRSMLLLGLLISIHTTMFYIVDKKNDTYNNFGQIFINRLLSFITLIFSYFTPLFLLIVLVIIFSNFQTIINLMIGPLYIIILFIILFAIFFSVFPVIYFIIYGLIKRNKDLNTFMDYINIAVNVQNENYFIQTIKYMVFLFSIIYGIIFSFGTELYIIFSSIPLLFKNDFVKNNKDSLKWYLGSLIIGLLYALLFRVSTFDVEYIFPCTAGIIGMIAVYLYLIK